MSGVTVEKLLKIGIALSEEKDGDVLLSNLLDSAMDITGCDAGTLYVSVPDALVFKIMVTKSMNYRKGGKGDPITLPPVPLTRKNVCTCSALDKKLINIADVYNSDLYDFSGPRKYDAMTGFKTTSMLVVPLEDNYGEIIGVLQLINALDENGTPIPFSAEYEPVISSIGSQAAISLTNMNYAAEIVELLDSFVKVMSTAIDARTPYNANHTRNMVKYGDRFITWLNNTDEDWKFDDSERREFLMSVWLHDIGKLVIPLEVMDKESRLGAELENVAHRFTTARLTAKIRRLSGDITEEQYNDILHTLNEGEQLIASVNKAGFLPDDTLEKIRLLGETEYTDENGEQKPLLTPRELVSLSVRKGTLTDDERGIMQSHVVMTEKMLGQMKFSRDYTHVPLWASGHHEFVNGRGYPKHLAGDDVTREMRLLTVLDVFDALTARDRPYKPPMPTEKALSILDKMAEDGQIDSNILALFKASDAWEE